MLSSIACWRLCVEDSDVIRHVAIGLFSLPNSISLCTYTVLSPFSWASPQCSVGTDRNIPAMSITDDVWCTKCTNMYISVEYMSRSWTAEIERILSIPCLERLFFFLMTNDCWFYASFKINVNYYYGYDTSFSSFFFARNTKMNQGYNKLETQFYLP